MEFKKALRVVYGKWADDEQIKEPFFLYSQLSDLCSSNYEESGKVAVFYKVDKKVGLFKALIENDDGILNRYNEVSEILSEKNYKSLIEIVKRIINGEESVQKKPIAVPKPNCVVKVNGAAPPKNGGKARKVNANKGTTPAPTPAPAPVVVNQASPLGTNLNTTSFWNTHFVKIVVGGAITIVSLFLISIFLAIIFGWPWTYWQWVIGIVVSTGLAIGSVASVVSSHDQDLCSYYILGPLICGAFSVVNFVLALIFKENYHIIFGCFSFYVLVGGGSLVLFTFADDKRSWLLGELVEVIFSIAAVIIVYSIA